MESKSGQIERTLSPDHTHTPLKTEARLEDGTGNSQQPQGFADFGSSSLSAANRHRFPQLPPPAVPSLCWLTVHFHDSRSKCVSNHRLWKFTQSMTKYTVQPALIRWGTKTTKWN